MCIRDRFDEVYICVSDNQHKNPLFSHHERMEMIEECTSDLDNVSAYSNPNNLVVKFAQKNEAVAIIRGLRHVSDFELEFQMANVNHGINPDISTILMVSNEKFLLNSFSFATDQFSSINFKKEFISSPFSGGIPP